MSDDLDLRDGEEALYCPDCETWLPCDCAGIPPNAEIRIYGGDL